jgi:hypothetical protein
MKLRRWFAAKSLAQAKNVPLEEALLGSRRVGYVWYRLKFFLVIQVVLLVIHLLEFSLLFNIFSNKQLLSAVFLYHALSLTGAFWWGALEPYRDEIKFRHGVGDERVLRERISGVLGFATLVGTVILLGAAIAFAWATWQAGLVTVFNLYFAALVFRLALGIPMRALHSSVYAVARVYRHAVSVFVVDFIFFASVLALWNWIGDWSFPVALFISAILGNALTLFYSVQTYRLLKFPRISIASVRANLGKGTRSLLSLTFFRAGLSYASIRMGSAMAMLTVLASGSRANPVGPIVFLFHVTSPLLNASGMWPQLFYFDFKKIGGALLFRFSKNFEKLLLLTSIVIAAVLTGLAAGSIAWTGRSGGLALTGLFGLLFLTRSVLSVLQIRSFTEGKHGWLVFGVLPLFAAYGFPHRPGAEGVLISLTGASLVGGLILLWRGRHAAYESGLAPELGPRHWLQALSRKPGPVTVGMIRLSAAAGGPSIGAIKKALLRDHGSETRLTQRGKNELFWFCKRELSLAELTLEFAGVLEEVQVSSGAFANGAAALEFVAEKGWLSELAPQQSPLTPLELERQFCGLFEGWIWKTTNQAALATLHADQGRYERSRTLVRILKEARRADFVTGRRERFDFDVSVYSPHGVIELLFVVKRPGGTDPEYESRRRRWKDLLKQAH